MKTRYLYSIPCFALTCALAGCSDDNKTSSAKPDQESSSPAAAAADPTQPVSSGLVAERAERLRLAALFPQDMSFMGGVYDIPGMIRGCQNLNMAKTWGSRNVEVEEEDESIAIPGENGSEAVVTEKSAEVSVTPCRIESPVIDAVIGFGPSWAGWLDSVQGTVGQMGLSQMQGVLAGYQTLQAISQGRSVDESEMSKMMNGNLGLLAQWAALVDLRPSQDKTAPVMVAVRLTPQAQAQVKATLEDANLPEDMELHGIISVYDKTYNGLACKVVEVDCRKLRVKLDEKVDDLVRMGTAAGKKSEVAVSPEVVEQLKTALKRLDESKLYVAVGFAGDTLVGFVTTNPELQVRLAASPRESVLSRPDFNMADAQLSHPAYGFFFADKATTKAMLNLDIAYYKGMLDGLTEVMQALGTDWKVADMAPSLAALDSAKGNLLGFYEKLAQNATAISCYAWQDKGVHLELSMYPTDFFKMAAPSAMNSVRPGASTVLYYSGCVNMQMVDMYRSLIEDASRIVWDFGNAYIANPKNKMDDQVRMVMPMVQMALPTIQELWKADKLACDALTGSSALVVDMQGAPSPMLQNVPAPRVTQIYEVKDRALLAQAWQKVKDASKMVVPLVSQGKMTELPAPKSSTEGDVTTYDYECPLGADLNPVVSVSDTRWAFSMPKAFGLDILKESMKAPGQVAPLEFQLNLLPVRDALKSVTDGSKDIKKAARVLDVITSDVTGVHATGRKAADGRDVYHLHVISAGK